jgi:hypothetical protein
MSQNEYLIQIQVNIDQIKGAFTLANFARNFAKPSPLVFKKIYSFLKKRASLMRNRARNSQV